MSARMIVDGRVVAATSRFNRNRYDTNPVTQRVYDLPNGGMPVGDAPPPPENTWTDEEGVRYRVVQRIEAHMMWVSAATIMRWYKLQYPEVMELFMRGLLDGAVEKGSQVKHYRVLNPVKVEEAAEKLVSMRMTGVRKRTVRSRKVEL